MKKFLALAVISVLVFALAIPTMAVTPISSNNVSGIDMGVLTREDSFAGPYNLATPLVNDEGTRYDTGTRGQLWVAWGDNSLYYYIEVTDKTPNHGDGKIDAVEFYIDWLTGGKHPDAGIADGTDVGGVVGAVEGFPYWQVRINAAPDLDGFQDISGAVWTGQDWGLVDWGANDAADTTTFVTGPLNGSFNNGYVIKAKIGAPAGVTLSEGMTIPVDFSIEDNAEGGDDKNGHIWLTSSDVNDTQWALPSSCQGLLTLGGAPVVEVPGGDAEVPAVDGGEDVGGGDDVPVVDVPVVTPSAPQVGDNGIIVMGFVMLAAAGVVVFRRKIAVK